MSIPEDLAKLVQFLQTLKSATPNATLPEVKTRAEMSATTATGAATAAVGATAVAGTTAAAGTNTNVPKASQVPAASTASAPNKNVKDNAEKTRLHKLVKAGKLPVAAEYLAKPPAGFDINAVDADGHNALWPAAMALDEPMAIFLLGKSITVIQNLDAGIGKENFETDTALKALLLAQAELNKTPSKVNERVISTHTRLFSAFQKQLKYEAKKFNISGNHRVLMIEGDGRLIVKPAILAQLETLKNDVVKRGGSTTLMDNTGKEQLAVYHGHKVPVTKKNYRLPPLFFVENHHDYSTRELIVRNFDFLKRLGYSRLCYEYDYNISLDDQLIVLAYFFSNEELQKQHSQGEILDISNRFRFLSEVKKQSQWLTYEGIDLEIEALRYSEKDRELVSSPSVLQSRDEAMAKRMVQATDTAQGGTITIAGGGHL